ncbi:hypothetical protein KY290_005423 [Solanum tuberosum]|uniref:Uncharacterized protein n=1 Tax=Solanum tuberosum TaxID=4113 RepID=A0ABQ7WFI0_SOLTU|nr:hypothetical protein KY289_006764 [Solanum tuberosum]KAH0778996.1 hypothetical protein KY290_005423 [Solanum tuberosum]
MLLCTQTVAADHEVIIPRRYGNHHPTVWGDHFLTYVDLPGVNEGEEMLVMAPSKSLHKLDLINTIQLLGVAYHFEHEIEESLSYMKFTNDQGNFKKELINNVHGMLSFYEAAQFRVHGEEILDEALNCTTTQLKLILPKLSNSHLAQQVANALKVTIKDSIVRVETRKYISFYQQNQNHNQVLLNFAKLDFNILQRLHKKELSDITRWWKELEMVNALPYIRDRLVEAYFWSLGVYFEPQYSVARKILAKISYITCIIDDTYDIYGTLDELSQFTRAIERWNIDASEQLPSYMKILYCHLLDVYKEIEKELANENKSFLVDYSIIEMKKVLRAYFQEAKWYYNKKEVPRMEQYMKNGIPSSGYLLLATTSWLAMGNITTKDVFDWTATEPPILVASCCITRLLNDLSSHEKLANRLLHPPPPGSSSPQPFPVPVFSKCPYPFCKRD